MEKRVLKLDIKKCLACRNNHDEMVFRNFGIPVVINGYTYLYKGVCPETGIEVYLKSESNKRMTTKEIV